MLKQGGALDLLRQELQGLKAYEPEEPLGDVALDANENPYAPPKAFMDLAQERLKGLALNRYPDPSCSALLKAASAYYGVPAASLLPGNGSDELIALLLTAFGGSGRRCLLPTPTFSMYALCAKGQGWEVLEEALDSQWQLTPAFVERAKAEKPALVFLSSPNNPTGQRFEDALVDALLELPLVLVLDEAYAEFASKKRSQEALQRPNLLVLRTLSKAFGLAGLRLGFLIGQEALLRDLNKLRLPYNIDALAQALGSLALEQEPLFRPAQEKLLQDKPRLEAGLKALPGAEVFASDANFFLFRHPAAQALHQHFLSRGLRLRRFSGARLKDCLRISVGTTSEVDRCLAALKEWKP
jgi:histidinol-phosphate aminotransferase